MPAPSSTPVKPKTPLQSAFSFQTPSRDLALDALGDSMVSRVVGPMPVQEFLSTYLPGISKDEIKAGMEKRFELVSDKSSENDAYFPFITAITPLVPDLSFVDTHARGDKDSGFGFEIKPDVSVYPGGRKKKNSHSDAKVMEMHIEFKWGNDPFVVPKETPPRTQQRFVKDTASAKDILGQIAAYAAAQMATQFRTHVFSVLLMRQSARLLRWDREGVVVTEPFCYYEEPLLLEFFRRYSEASLDERGFDTTISPAAEEEANLARERLGLPLDTPVFKTRVRRGDTATEYITIIFPDVQPLTELPACRATRGCSAYCVEEDCVVFFKDSWRIVAEGIVPEGDIYAKLNENGVQYVPICLASGDVVGNSLQRAQTLTCSKKEWACSLDLRVSAHSHYRIVLNIVGRALSEFAHTKELVQAIRDALGAHEGAYGLEILHRDISVGNIVIFNGRGYLIDWEMAKFLNSNSPRRTSRTGTWQFMSARLVEDRTAEHGAADDMESAFWVLLWTALMYSPSSTSDAALIKNTFDSEEGSQMKRSIFTSQTIFDSPLFPEKEALNMLLKELADLFKYYYDKVEKSDEGILAEVESSNLSEQVWKHLPQFRRKEARERLKNHTFILEVFDKHLGMSWPTNDAAQGQKFVTGSPYDTREVTMRKTKHTLEVINGKGESKRRRCVTRKAISENVLGAHSPNWSSNRETRRNTPRHGPHL